MGRPTHDSNGFYIMWYDRGPGPTSTLFKALEGTDGGTRYLGGNGSNSSTMEESNSIDENVVENKDEEQTDSGDELQDNDDKKKKNAKKNEKKGEKKPSYTPPPKEVPEFPGAEKAKPKGGRARWKLPDGDIIEWDGQHGEWERYNPRGKHKGVWSREGEKIKDPVPGRKIDPTTVVVGTAATVATAYIIYKVVVALATWECLGCGVLITP